MQIINQSSRLRIIVSNFFSNYSNVIHSRHFSTTDRALNSSENDLKIQYLKSTFEVFNKPSNFYVNLLEKNPKLAKFQHASVLVPLTIRLEKNKKGNFVQKMFYTLSKRTELMNTFKGQVCFIGGKQDDTDESIVHTAYREAEEEVNIRPNQLTFLAQTCPILTYGGVLVYPVIAYFDQTTYQPKLNEKEVEMIFEIPTERFLCNERHSFESIKNGDDEYFMHYFDDVVADRVDGSKKQVTTWGATAFICTVISSMIHMRPAEFIVDPQLDLNNDNIIKYFDDYLLVKSNNLINVLSDIIAKK